jgi:hypothetical protein
MRVRFPSRAREFSPQSLVLVLYCHVDPGNTTVNNGFRIWLLEILDNFTRRNYSSFVHFQDWCVWHNCNTLKVNTSTHELPWTTSSWRILEFSLRVSVLCYDQRSVGQSVFVWSTHLGHTTRFYYCQRVAGLLMWGTLSEERTGLPFTIAAGPRQRSHSSVWVPRDSWPYFTVSDLRLPQPGRSRSLLPATSRHIHTWHRAPLGPMAIYLFNVKTFVFFFFRWSSSLIKEGLFFFYIYRLFTYTVLHLRLYSFFFSQGFSRIYINLINY